MAEVTVVIPTRNRRKLLARTLHSVLAQQDVDLAVVVVDDGGTDGTEASLAQLEDSRLSVVRHAESRGVSAARNSGIARADSPWVAFVDDDDLWAPDKLRSQLDALAEDPETRWCCAGSVDIDAGCTVLSEAPPPTEPDVSDALLVRNVIPGGGSGVVASRQLTLDVGGFDEALSNLADWDFYTRLALRSPVATVARPCIGYYVHPQGMAHNIQRSAVEHGYLEVKYGRERARRGVAFHEPEWLLYLASLAYNGGQMLTGLRMHAELVVRHRRWRSLRKIAIGVAPQRVREARARRYTPPAPRWAAEAEAWLAPYREGWLD